MTRYHPLVKRLLDGESRLAELPPELQAEGAEALRLLAVADRTPVSLPAALDARVMTAVRAGGRSPSARLWRWIFEPRELRFRVRPWVVGPALAAAAALVVLLNRSPAPRRGGSTAVVAPESALVRFVFYAPAATRVAIAGTFNQWDQSAAPLVRAGKEGVWTVTLVLPRGQYQYAFVVDGRRWVPDPAAPAVDDGFGRRNSLIAVGGGGRAL
jgi:hypothetical protein